jgi:hypothetical protein
VLSMSPRETQVCRRTAATLADSYTIPACM